jgi:hypothetical protein
VGYCLGIQGGAHISRSTAELRGYARLSATGTAAPLSCSYRKRRHGQYNKAKGNLRRWPPRRAEASPSFPKPCFAAESGTRSALPSLLSSLQQPPPGRGSVCGPRLRCHRVYKVRYCSVGGCCDALPPRLIIPLSSVCSSHFHCWNTSSVITIVKSIVSLPSMYISWRLAVLLSAAWAAPTPVLRTALVPLNRMCALSQHLRHWFPYLFELQFLPAACCLSEPTIASLGALPYVFSTPPSPTPFLYAISVNHPPTAYQPFSNPTTHLDSL